MYKYKTIIRVNPKDSMDISIKQIKIPDLKWYHYVVGYFKSYSVEGWVDLLKIVGATIGLFLEVIFIWLFVSMLILI